MGLYMATPKQTDLLLVKELLEAGSVMPVIDRTFSFSETAAALRYMEEGHPKGKIVITI